MKWYYTVRGDAIRHGLADEAELLEMAHAGRLKRTDLVWNQKDGTRWVPAYTIPGLFPPATPPPLAASPAAQAPARSALPAERRRFTLLAWTGVVIALALLALALWVARRA